MINVEVINRQSVFSVDETLLSDAVRRVLGGEGISRAVVNLAVVLDAEIHCLNRQFLNHDYATDVLSFVLDKEDDRLEGEIVVSAETAVNQAARFGWRPADELLLYVVHGALHLAGYDDTSPSEAEKMRQRERYWLAPLGIEPRWTKDSTTAIVNDP